MYCHPWTHLPLRPDGSWLVDDQTGDRVLETSIGTGGNLKFLPRGASYWGLDISRGMLRLCQRTVRRLGIRAELCLGAAEAVPHPLRHFKRDYH